MREVEYKSVSVRRLGEKQTYTRSLEEIVIELKADATPPDLR